MDNFNNNSLILHYVFISTIPKMSQIFSSGGKWKKELSSIISKISMGAPYIDLPHK
jgi:hypothetical protein